MQEQKRGHNTQGVCESEKRSLRGHDLPDIINCYKSEIIKTVCDINLGKTNKQ